MRCAAGAWQAAQDTTSRCKPALGSHFWWGSIPIRWHPTQVSYAVWGCVPSIFIPVHPIKRSPGGASPPEAWLSFLMRDAVSLYFGSVCQRLGAKFPPRPETEPEQHAEPHDGP